jgi:uncharacterized protein
MFTALLVGGATFWGNIFYGILVGVLTVLLTGLLMKGKVVGQIANVREGNVYFDGANLFVDNIHFMNLGSQEARETYLQRALGVVIEPLNDNGRATLANNGQRMAIAHDAAALLGVYRDVDTAEFMPIVRRHLDTGRVGLVICPLRRI